MFPRVIPGCRQWARATRAPHDSGDPESIFRPDMDLGFWPSAKPGMTEEAQRLEPPMEPLKFVAFDTDDLEVVATHLQDAEVKVADVHWRPQEKRLVLGLDRFDWLSAHASTPELRRCRSALRFERVLGCKCKNVKPDGKDAILNLLTLDFEPTDAPAGVVTLFFSGGPVLRLEVECLEVELADLGPSWSTDIFPKHGEDELKARPDIQS
jgi:hypothetical protein